MKTIKFIAMLLLAVLLFACTQYDRDILEQINRKLDDFEYRLAALERSVYTNQKAVENLQNDVKKISDELSNAKKLISEQKNIPIVSQEDVSQILARINLLEMRFNQLSVALNVSDIRQLIYKISDLETAQKQQQIAYERFVRITEELLSQVNAEETAKRLSGLENSVTSISNQISELLELSSRLRALENAFDALSVSPHATVVDVTGLEREIFQMKSKMQELEVGLRREMERKFEEISSRQTLTSPADLQQYVANIMALVQQLNLELEMLRGVVREYDRERFLRLDEDYITYVVKPNDTLSSIMKAYGLGQDKLRVIMELNNIQDPNELLVGQRIKIPIEDRSRLFAYPLEKPLSLEDVVSTFGRPTGTGVTTGITISLERGSRVLSILPGRIVSIMQTESGYYVRIDHGNGILAVYGNLSTVSVTANSWVSRGQILGTVDGLFHFEIWIDGEPRDPLRILLKYVGKFEATFYSEWDDGKLPEHPTFRVTALGTIPKEWRTLAADPSVIPLGSLVYIPQFADKPNFGLFVVEDTGLLIKNNIIDIYVNSPQLALQNMRNEVDVYLVAPNTR
ncbi:peptidoglycan-binding protein [Thermotoga sp. Ku-13t]|uniref:peptidoglycan DD-metalloendopeptidase family protein n=1 Tax=Thermotoga sp. Ku-13t TaxID=1755813 RepID=UPI0013EB6143|nr:peptidoglycan DD-metalloendopeptidase family protein [Thermotoga sp. Ku-13t]KAF2957346.1 peptidoglycan-binding protein [Thermotoga sp. Ku-13t]